jgi:capsular exopolysaccharide synthesis family protein
MNSPLASDQDFQPGIARKQPEINTFKEVLAKAFRNWYWFVFSVLLCYGVAKVYLRWFTTPSYSIGCRFLIKKQGSSGGGSDELSQVNIVSNSNSDVANEMEIIKTRLLMNRVVRRLHLNVGYFMKGRFKSTELYGTAPFTANLVYLGDSALSRAWNVSSSPDGQKVILSDGTTETARSWGDTMVFKDMSLVLKRSIPGDVSPLRGSYILTITPEEQTVTSYLNSTKITQAGDGENVIQLNIIDGIPRRGEDVLNTLYDEYTKANVDDQNSIADNTIEFINNRLDIVHRELSGVEKNIQDFKTSNKLTSLEDQTKMVLNTTDGLNKELAQHELQLEVLKTVEDRLQSKEDRIVPPTILSQDPTYATLVSKFNALVLQRDAELGVTRPANPIIRQMNAQIDTVKEELLLSLDNVRSSEIIAKNGLTAKLNEMMGVIQGTPSKERAFLDISREQAVKQQLYLFLLQKREETAISKSGTLANSRLIDPARADGAPFSPNHMNIYMIALVVGLIVPAGTIYLKEFLNNKIVERRDINNQTDTPILGEIGHNKTGNPVVVTHDARSIIAEQFRSIRTNLRFLLTGKQHQVILITSSMSGEGKSFISLNLASSLALSGKKVVLLELDLRKPRLSSLLGLPNDEGISNFIVSNMDLKYLPKPAPDQHNLFIISSGPIPPNPAELLLQDKMKTLFEYLYANFDFIVIDTPPVGLVSDALLVSHYADACLYVTRQNYTFKQQIGIVNDLFVHRKMKGLSIIVNDVDNTQRRYGYGYRYGGEGSYYTEEPTKKGFWSKMPWKDGQ